MKKVVLLAGALAAGMAVAPVTANAATPDIIDIYGVDVVPPSTPAEAVNLLNKVVDDLNGQVDAIYALLAKEEQPVKDAFEPLAVQLRAKVGLIQTYVATNAATANDATEYPKQLDDAKAIEKACKGVAANVETFKEYLQKVAALPTIQTTSEVTSPYVCTVDGSTTYTFDATAANTAKTDLENELKKLETVSTLDQDATKTTLNGLLEAAKTAINDNNNAVQAALDAKADDDAYTELNGVLTTVQADLSVSGDLATEMAKSKYADPIYDGIKTTYNGKLSTYNTELANYWATEVEGKHDQNAENKAALKAALEKFGTDVAADVTDFKKACNDAAIADVVAKIEAVEGDLATAKTKAEGYNTNRNTSSDGEKLVDTVQKANLAEIASLETKLATLKTDVQGKTPVKEVDDLVVDRATVSGYASDLATLSGKIDTDQTAADLAAKTAIENLATDAQTDLDTKKATIDAQLESWGAHLDTVDPTCCAACKKIVADAYKDVQDDIDALKTKIETALTQTKQVGWQAEIEAAKTDIDTKVAAVEAAVKSAVEEHVKAVKDQNELKTKPAIQTIYKTWEDATSDAATYTTDEEKAAADVWAKKQAVPDATDLTKTVVPTDFADYIAKVNDLYAALETARIEAADHHRLAELVELQTKAEGLVIANNYDQHVKAAVAAKAAFNEVDAALAAVAVVEGTMYADDYATLTDDTKAPLKTVKDAIAAAKTAYETAYNDGKAYEYDVVTAKKNLLAAVDAYNNAVKAAQAVYAANVAARTALELVREALSAEVNTVVIADVYDDECKTTLETAKAAIVNAAKADGTIAKAIQTAFEAKTLSTEAKQNEIKGLVALQTAALAQLKADLTAAQLLKVNAEQSYADLNEELVDLREELDHIKGDHYAEGGSNFAHDAEGATDSHHTVNGYDVFYVNELAQEVADLQTEIDGLRAHAHQIFEQKAAEQAKINQINEKIKDLKNAIIANNNTRDLLKAEWENVQSDMAAALEVIGGYENLKDTDAIFAEVAALIGTPGGAKGKIAETIEKLENEYKTGELGRLYSVDALGKELTEEVKANIEKAHDTITDLREHAAYTEASNVYADMEKYYNDAVNAAISLDGVCDEHNPDGTNHEFGEYSKCDAANPCAVCMNAEELAQVKAQLDAAKKAIEDSHAVAVKTNHTDDALNNYGDRTVKPTEDNLAALLKGVADCKKPIDDYTQHVNDADKAHKDADDKAYKELYANLEAAHIALTQAWAKDNAYIFNDDVVCENFNPETMAIDEHDAHADGVEGHVKTTVRGFNHLSEDAAELDARLAEALYHHYCVGQKAEIQKLIDELNQHVANAVAAVDANNETYELLCNAINVNEGSCQVKLAEVAEAYPRQYMYYHYIKDMMGLEAGTAAAEPTIQYYINKLNAQVEAEFLSGHSADYLHEADIEGILEMIGSLVELIDANDEAAEKYYTHVQELEESRDKTICDLNAQDYTDRVVVVEGLAINENHEPCYDKVRDEAIADLLEVCKAHIGQPIHKDGELDKEVIGLDRSSYQIERDEDLGNGVLYDTVDELIEKLDADFFPAATAVTDRFQKDILQLDQNLKDYKTFLADADLYYNETIKAELKEAITDNVKHFFEGQGTSDFGTTEHGTPAYGDSEFTEDVTVDQDIVACASDKIKGLLDAYFAAEYPGTGDNAAYYALLDGFDDITEGCVDTYKPILRDLFVQVEKARKQVRRSVATAKDAHDATHVEQDVPAVDLTAANDKFANAKTIYNNAKTAYADKLVAEKENLNNEWIYRFILNHNVKVLHEMLRDAEGLLAVVRDAEVGGEYHGNLPCDEEQGKIDTTDYFKQLRDLGRHFEEDRNDIDYAYAHKHCSHSEPGYVQDFEKDKAAVEKVIADAQAELKALQDKYEWFKQNVDAYEELCGEWGAVSTLDNAYTQIANVTIYNEDYTEDPFVKALVEDELVPMYFGLYENITNIKTWIEESYVCELEDGTHKGRTLASELDDIYMQIEQVQNILTQFTNSFELAIEDAHHLTNGKSIYSDQEYFTLGFFKKANDGSVANGQEMFKEVKVINNDDIRLYDSRAYLWNDMGTPDDQSDDEVLLDEKGRVVYDKEYNADDIFDVTVLTVGQKSNELSFNFHQDPTAFERATLKAGTAEVDFLPGSISVKNDDMDEAWVLKHTVSIDGIDVLAPEVAEIEPGLYASNGKLIVRVDNPIDLTYTINSLIARTDTGVEFSYADRELNYAAGQIEFTLPEGTQSVELPEGFFTFRTGENTIARSAAVVVTVGKGTTSIDELVAMGEKAQIFDLQGRRVKAESLISGNTYVVNGEKVMVK